jgi:exonuclease VII large subunit
MLNDRCKSISSQIAEWQNQLRMYAKRLDSLRATKLIKLNNLISADNPDNEYADNLSELSESSSNLSSSSHSSLYSSKSSKIRTKKRKQVERKKKQIKEGSQYEDAAILVRLKEMYKEIDSLQG